MQTTHWIVHSKLVILITRGNMKKSQEIILAEQNLIEALKLGLITFEQYLDLYRKLEE